MAISLKHTTQAAGTDYGNGEIRKAQWNEEHNLQLGTGKLMGRSSAGTGVAEEISIGNGLTLASGILTNALFGFMPRSSTVSGTLTASEAGKVLLITGAVTINPSVFAQDNVFAIYNNTSGALNVTQGASMTLRTAATATTGTISLPQRGWMTLWFVTASEAVCSGAF